MSKIRSKRRVIANIMSILSECDSPNVDEFVEYLLKKFSLKELYQICKDRVAEADEE